MRKPNRDMPAGAFPAIIREGRHNELEVGSDGLTKRETAAMIAMHAGRISQPNASASVLAIAAVLDADALFDELEKPDTTL